MRNLFVNAVSVPTDEIKLNPTEVARRLNIPFDYTNDAIEKCFCELKKVISYKYAYIKVPVEFKAKNICDLGFGDIESMDLCKALKNCNQAYILGATIGIGADRLIKKLEISSPAEAFITDALGSAAAEALCDYADFTLRKQNYPFRFSAGYGDMPLSCQTEILKTLNAEYTLGISLNNSLLMTPMKSITAILGIKEEI